MAKIEVGDWVRVLLPVYAVWEDDTITVGIGAQRVTISSEAKAIEEVVKGEKPRRKKLVDKAD